MWKIETEIILVLKAHYMGRMFVETGKNLPNILDSINSAINELDLRNEKKDKIRQIFYILLKVEILRDSHDIIDLRKRAKEISEIIGSNVFNYFMAVQEVTSPINKVHGMQTGIISNDKARIGFTVDSWLLDYTNPMSDFEGFCLMGPASRALNLEGIEISDKEHDFIISTSLKEMLENHGLLSDTL
jgi:hypothetical protein